MQGAATATLEPGVTGRRSQLRAQRPIPTRPRGPRSNRGVGVALGAAASVALVAIVVLAGIPAGPVTESLLPVGSSAPPPPGSPNPPGSPAPPPAVTPGVSCNRVTTPTPSSILIPVPGPTPSLSAGGTVSAVFEFLVQNESSAQVGIGVDVPSVFATFPLASGGSVSIYVAPHDFSLSGPGWMSASRSTGSFVASSTLTFATGGSAVLSSQKLAVLANASYGSVTLELRWHWTLTPTSGTNTTGAWSTPTGASGWPSSVPSIFEPAPQISVLSQSGPSGTIGDNFTARLGGIVASRYFFLELESASTGKVAQNSGQTAAAGATATTVAIVLLNYDRYLYPGNYLVHIHDACGALLVSLPLNASYAASTLLTVHIQPAGCGPVTFAGKTYADNRSFSVAPSSTPYSVSVPACTGHPFHGWHFSGGVYLYSANQLLISASGSFTVDYS
jgi:hypothetical protein